MLLGASRLSVEMPSSLDPLKVTKIANSILKAVYSRSGVFRRSHPLLGPIITRENLPPVLRLLFEKGKENIGRILT